MLEGDGRGSIVSLDRDGDERGRIAHRVEREEGGAPRSAFGDVAREFAHRHQCEREGGHALSPSDVPAVFGDDRAPHRSDVVIGGIRGSVRQADERVDVVADVDLRRLNQGAALAAKGRVVEGACLIRDAGGKSIVSVVLGVVILHGEVEEELGGRHIHHAVAGTLHQPRRHHMEDQLSVAVELRGVGVAIDRAALAWEDLGDTDGGDAGGSARGHDRHIDTPRRCELGARVAAVRDHDAQAITHARERSHAERVNRVEPIAGDHAQACPGSRGGRDARSERLSITQLANLGPASLVVNYGLPP